MLPQTQPHKKRNSSKMNLLISFIFHSVLVLVLLYFAARQGILGNQLKKITVQMVKEKPPEKPTPEKPKIQVPRVETPKIAEKPKVVEETKAPPPVIAPPVAPPAAVLPSFDFGGGKAVETSSDPMQIYKGALEYAFLSKWNRPDNLTDDNFVAEVQISVDRDGQISKPRWEKGSGNPLWDESVHKAVAAVKSMDRPPPTNFPSQVVVRFDVRDETESVIQ
jgi:TonB C terminal